MLFRRPLRLPSQVHPRLFRQFRKRNSRKFVCRILHSPGPNEPGSPVRAPILWTGPHCKLWCWISMRRGANLLAISGYFEDWRAHGSGKGASVVMVLR